MRDEPNQNGWLLTQKRIFHPAITLQVDRAVCKAAIAVGFLTNVFLLEGDPNANLSFSQKHNGHMQALADLLRVPLKQSQPAGANVEFA